MATPQDDQARKRRQEDAAREALAAQAKQEGDKLAAAATPPQEPANDASKLDPRIPLAGAQPVAELERAAVEASRTLVDMDTRDGELRRADSAAIARLEAMQDELARLTDDERKADSEKWQYFIRCRRGHIGVFLHENPNGRELGNEDWFATYRAANEIWREEVYCQVCYNADRKTLDMRGERMPLQLTYTGSRRVRGRPTPRFVVPSRWVFRYLKDTSIARTKPNMGIERGARVDGASGNPDWSPSEEQERRQREAAANARKLVGGAA